MSDETREIMEAVRAAGLTPDTLDFEPRYPAYVVTFYPPSGRELRVATLGRISHQAHQAGLRLKLTALTEPGEPLERVLAQVVTA